MAGRNIDVGIKAHDESRAAFTQAQANLRKLKTESGGVATTFKEVGQIGKQVVGTLKQVAVAAGAAFGLGFSLGEVITSLKKIIDEMRNTEQAMRRLAFQAGTFGLNVKDTAESVKALRAEMDKLYGVANSTTTALFAQGIRLGLTNDESARAVKLAAELSENYGQELVQAFAMVSSAMRGNEDAIKDLGEAMGLAIMGGEHLKAVLQALDDAGLIRSLREEQRKVMPGTPWGDPAKWEAIEKAIQGIQQRTQNLRGDWGAATKALQEYLATSTGSTFGGPAAPPGIDRAALAESRFGSAGRMIDTRSFEEELEEINEMARHYGAGFAGAFQLGAIEAFDEDVGMREAFRNLGGNLRDELVGQMSGAALDPLKAEFGILAQALAAPFKLVGQIIAAPINAITNVVAGVIQKLVAELAVMLGIQQAAAVTGTAAIAAVGTEVAALGGPMGALAAAAAIGSFGAALAFGPLALAQIAASAGTVASLTVPTGLAEGGLVMPRPGGVPAIIAEAGQPELVIPLDKAERMGIGGRRGGITINVAVGDVRSNADLDRIAERVAYELDRAERRIGRRRLS